MHAVKVAWVGQTFALAKGNDSGGKKSRIRRSKEERKAMVESFIKKYQNSNSGNFPSLNLTHKEVGGSFYTVREIVREIIQENRVLGPAKLAANEHNNDQFSELYPLGSISIEPQGHFSSNEIHFVSNDHQNISKELVSTSSSQITSQQQQRFDNGRYINGILVDEECKETDASKSSMHVNEEMLYTDAQISLKSEGVENIVEASTSKVTCIETDVLVETFPVNSTTKLTKVVDRRSEDDLTGTLEQKETKEVASEPGKTGYMLDRLDYPENHDFGAMDEKSVANQVISSVMECMDLEVDASHNDGLTLQTSDQNQLVAGIESELVSNDAYTNNTNKNNMRSTCEELLSQERVEIESKAQNTFITEEGKNSTLNRTKLESWEGSSKKPADAETNPLWAVFKAFVTAFVKFWTE